MRCGDENIEKEIEQIILKIINDLKAVKPSADSKSENLEVRKLKKIEKYRKIGRVDILWTQKREQFFEIFELYE